MRATKAYIASLGTTGVLLGASILMLAVVSAVVAFDGWPSGTVSTRVQTLVLADTPAPIRVSGTATAGRSAATGRAVGPRVTNLRRVAGRHFSGGRLGTPVTSPGTGGPLPTTPPVPPVKLPPPPIDIAGAPDSVRSQIADQTQAATNSAGVSVGKVSPEIGQAVTDAGTTAADALRKLPLPHN